MEGVVIDTNVFVAAGFNARSASERILAAIREWRLLTPHVAGYGPHLDERRYDIILDNCRRFLAGQPLRNLVDKARWF